MSESEKTEDRDVFSYERIVCREGKKIWLAYKENGYSGGLTSEIIGTCDN
ncbi:hypothetical protein LJB88_04485 [Erysipelotrichaceae bacterium OttesenSCG-928-M19]|nr:hypothetical protein [Erysipelotrichaceae bacterium OttesenSCG-928-M19]